VRIAGALDNYRVHHGMTFVFVTLAENRQVDSLRQVAKFPDL